MDAATDAKAQLAQRLLEKKRRGGASSSSSSQQAASSSANAAGASHPPASQAPLKSSAAASSHGQAHAQAQAQARTQAQAQAQAGAPSSPLPNGLAPAAPSRSASTVHPPAAVHAQTHAHTSGVALPPQRVASNLAVAPLDPLAQMTQRLASTLPGLAPIHQVQVDALAELERTIASQNEVIQTLIRDKGELAQQLLTAQRQSAEHARTVGEMRDSATEQKLRADTLDRTVQDLRARCDQQSRAQEDGKANLARANDRVRECEQQLRESRQSNSELVQRLQRQLTSMEHLEIKNRDLSKAIALKQLEFQQIVGDGSSSNGFSPLLQTSAPPLSNGAVSATRQAGAEKLGLSAIVTENTELHERVLKLESALRQVQEDRNSLASELQLETARVQTLTTQHDTTARARDSDAKRISDLEAQLQDAQRNTAAAVASATAAAATAVASSASASGSESSTQPPNSHDEALAAATSRASQARIEELERLLEAKAAESAAETQSLRLQIEKLQGADVAQREQTDTQAAAMVALQAKYDQQLEQLSALRVENERYQASMYDRDSLLGKLRSDGETISKATSQNRALKAQVTELEDRFVQIMNSNAQLTESAHSEQHRASQLEAQCSRLQQELDAIQAGASSGILSSNGDAANNNNDEDAEVSAATTLRMQQLELENSRLTDENEQLNQTVFQTQALLKAQQMEHAQHHHHHHDDSDAEPSSSSSSQSQQQHQQQQSSLADTDIISRVDHEAEVNALRSSLRSHETMREELQTKMDKLQGHFVQVVDEKTALVERLAQEQHLSERLALETDTVGEYILMYQAERAALKKKFEERNTYIEQLLEEREIQKHTLSQLKRLLLRYMALEGIVPLPGDSEAVDQAPESVQQQFYNQLTDSIQTFQRCRRPPHERTPGESIEGAPPPSPPPEQPLVLLDDSTRTMLDSIEGTATSIEFLPCKKCSATVQVV
ncbi:hypothetical protein CAOG_04888 [Capsaspora owczarzaki ATCC 30864]|uniref:Golgin subfamily A conserved domain-containing protein n=1 Tax=Capsaspora owczarzaki (strain ATCC 30864) TaxID=595528 RepID=A0A0D2WQY9_CAPO3|nr:hypothetical protein CAOG_04888 [Capsaspora owczarzaki ATCC 30864]KJE94210.1 hypothetical protein CAOG_004888 [Capsaspora owczarzaki ATCC 30864]|eukprot:XP_004347639.1 hypothetical protein CAOG_04888 [Capsaspora owczarzaki ATCC 30864]